MSKMNICKNEENWTCRNIEVAVDTPLNFVKVPAHKVSNKYTFVCKRHYVNILTEELGLNSLPGNNATYNPGLIHSYIGSDSYQPGDYFC